MKILSKIKRSYIMEQKSNPAVGINNSLSAESIAPDSKLIEPDPHKNVKKEVHRLENAFSDAVKEGADAKTLASIIYDWKKEYDYLNTLEKNLFDGRSSDEQPDALQDYVRHSKTNLATSVGSLADKTKNFVEQAKSGIIPDGKTLTEKIKNAHQKIMSMFHKKQAELGQKLGKFIDNIKDKVREKADMARLNTWVKATEKAENYRAKGEDSKEERIQNLQDKLTANLEGKLQKNSQKFQKTVDDIANGVPSFKDRVSMGSKIIRDAVQGKEYKEYKVDKDTKEAADELRNAKEALKKADAKAIMLGKMKWGVIKAWTSLTVAFNNFKANQLEKMADKAKDSLDKVERPEIKDYYGEVKSAMDKGMSMKEAVAHVDNLKNGTPGKTQEKNVPSRTEDIGGR